LIRNDERDALAFTQTQQVLGHGHHGSCIAFDGRGKIRTVVWTGIDNQFAGASFPAYPCPV